MRANHTQDVERIVVTQRSHDFHAQIEGDPGIWGCGYANETAVGALITAHCERFGIAIKWSNGSTTANWVDAARAQEQPDTGSNA